MNSGKLKALLAAGTVAVVTFVFSFSAMAQPLFDVDDPIVAGDGNFDIVFTDESQIYVNGETIKINVLNDHDSDYMIQHNFVIKDDMTSKNVVEETVTFTVKGQSVSKEIDISNFEDGHGYTVTLSLDGADDTGKPTDASMNFVVKKSIDGAGFVMTAPVADELLDSTMGTTADPLEIEWVNPVMSATIFKNSQLYVATVEKGAAAPNIDAYSAAGTTISDYSTVICNYIDDSLTGTKDLYMFIKVTDQLKNEISTTPRKVTLDREAPEAVTLIEPMVTEKWVKNVDESTVEFTWNAVNSEDLDYYLFEVNGPALYSDSRRVDKTNTSASWSWLDAMATGDSIVTISAVDTAGNKGNPATFTVRIDGTAPTTPLWNNGTLTEPIYVGENSTSQEYTLKWHNSEDNESGVDHYKITDSAATVTPGDIPAAGPLQYKWLYNAALEDGNYTVTVTPVDAVGNEGSPATFDFIIDNTAPTDVEIQSPDDGIYIGPESMPSIIDIVWAKSEDTGSGIAYYEITDKGHNRAPYYTSFIQFDASNPSTYTYSWDYDTNQVMSDGPLTVRIRAFDKAGNMSNYTDLTINCDSASPSVPSWTDETASANGNTFRGPNEGYNTLDIKWNASQDPNIADGVEGSGVEKYEIYDNSKSDYGVTTQTINVENTQEPYTYQWKYDQYDKITDGTVTITVVAVDKVGNKSPASTFTFTVDSTKPEGATITLEDALTVIDADNEWNSITHGKLMSVFRDGEEKPIEIELDAGSDNLSGISSVTATLSVTNDESVDPITETWDATKESLPNKWTITPYEFSQFGTYYSDKTNANFGCTLTIEVKDKSGNVLTQEGDLFLIYTVKPEISDLKLTSEDEKVDNTTLILESKINDSISGLEKDKVYYKVQFWTGIGYEDTNWSTFVEGNNTDGNVNLGTTQGGWYRVQAYSRDNLGNVSSVVPTNAQLWNGPSVTDIQTDGWMYFMVDKEVPSSMSLVSVAGVEGNENNYDYIDIVWRKSDDIYYESGRGMVAGGYELTGVDSYTVQYQVADNPVDGNWINIPSNQLSKPNPQAHDYVVNPETYNVRWTLPEGIGGKVNIRVQVKDKAKQGGNENVSDIKFFYVDKKAPFNVGDIEIIRDQDNGAAEPTFKWGASDDPAVNGYASGMDYYEITVKNLALEHYSYTENIAHNDSEYYTYTIPNDMLLSNGRYIVTVVAVDKAGNRSVPVSEEYLVNLNVPQIEEIDMGLVDNICPESELTASFSVIPGYLDISHFELKVYSVDDNDNKDVLVIYKDDISADATDVTMNILQDAKYMLELTVFDMAGNTGKLESSKFLIDTTAPSVPVLTNMPNNPTKESNNLNFIWSASEDNITESANIKYTAILDDTDVVDNLTNILSYSHVGALEDGIHTFSVWATDMAGHSSEPEVYEFLVDTTSPRTADGSDWIWELVNEPISSINGINYINTSMPTFRWDGLNDGEFVEFPVVSGVKEYILTVVASSGGMEQKYVVPYVAANQSVTYTLPDQLAIDEEYTVTISAIDFAGNEFNTTSPTDIKIIAKTAFTTVAPENLARTFDDSYESDEPIAKFTWSEVSDVSGNMVGSYLVRTFIGDTEHSSQTVTTNSAVVNFQIDGIYTIKVSGIDSFGNVGEPAVLENVIIDTTAPSVPVITSGPVDPTNAKEYTVIWDASTDALSGIQGYNVWLNGELKSTVPQTETEYRFSYSDLSGDGEVKVEVSAIDNAKETGNESDKAVYTFVVDTIAPAAPEGLSLLPVPENGENLIGAINPAFTWNQASEEGSGVVGYILTISDGAGYTSDIPMIGQPEIGQPIRFATSDVLTAGIYTATVASVDAAGNVTTEELAEIIFYVYDVEPVVDTLNVTTFEMNSVQNFEWSVSVAEDAPEGVKVAGYIFRVLDASGTVLIEEELDAETVTKSVGPLADGNYTVSVAAIDNIGNIGVAKTATFKVDTTAPSVPVITSGPVDPTNAKEYTVIWDASTDALSGIQGYNVWLNGELKSTVPQTETEYRFSYSDLSGDGEVKVEVSAIDNAKETGNESDKAVYTFVVDTIAPAAPANFMPEQPTDGTMCENDGVYFVENIVPMFRWDRVTDNGTPIHYIFTITDSEDYIVEESTVPQSNFDTVRHKVNNKLPYGEYTISLVAEDAAGNRSDEIIVAVKIQETIDLNKIVISDIKLVGTDQTTVPLNLGSTVAYTISGLPTNVAARSQITMKVTVNGQEAKVDEQLYKENNMTIEGGTENYYIIMDSDFIAQVIGTKSYPADIEVKVTLTNGINEKSATYTFWIESERLGFGFGKIRPVL